MLDPARLARRAEQRRIVHPVGGGSPPLRFLSRRFCCRQQLTQVGKLYDSGRLMRREQNLQIRLTSPIVSGHNQFADRSEHGISRVGNFYDALGQVAFKGIQAIVFIIGKNWHADCLETGVALLFDRRVAMLKSWTLTLPITAAAILAASLPASADIISATDATNPLAFFPLQSADEGSTVNGYTSAEQNGAKIVASNGGPQANALSLNGVNSSTPQYESTSLSGGINGKGSIDAWVNLASLNGGAIEYIAGESQVGNDFDFQFVNGPIPGVNEDLCFYSDSGSNTCATIADSALLNTWNMVTATYDSSAPGTPQDVYLNGVLIAANSNGSNTASKSGQFNIGYSTVFANRDLNGLLSDVGVWNYQLSATQVASLFAAGKAPTPAVPEPGSLALFGSALGAVSLIGWRKRKTG